MSLALAPTVQRVGAVCAAADEPRRTLAYAAHELRDEITFQRTLAEVTLADPDADIAALRTMGERIAAACARQGRLLEALLTLARSEGAPPRRERVDLATIAADVVALHGQQNLASTTTLAPAVTAGDPQLVERLVANLVANAVTHNVAGGRLDIATYTARRRATVTVTNTGPLIAAREIERLFEPFARLSQSGGGVGLGLAIVHAIASAHDATVAARARTGGGLAIAVAFPALD